MENLPIIRGIFVINLQTAVLIWIILLLSAVLYNILVSSLKGRHAGYTSFLVAGGVLFTIIGVAVVFWQAAVAVLIAFAATGIPMIVGEAVRSKRMSGRIVERYQSQAEKDAHGEKQA